MLPSSGKLDPQKAIEDMLGPNHGNQSVEDLQRRLDGYYETTLYGDDRTAYDGAWGCWTVPLVILSAIAALVILGCLAERFLP